MTLFEFGMLLFGSCMLAWMWYLSLSLRRLEDNLEKILVQIEWIDIRQRQEKQMRENEALKKFIQETQAKLE